MVRESAVTTGWIDGRFVVQDRQGDSRRSSVMKVGAGNGDDYCGGVWLLWMILPRCEVAQVITSDVMLHTVRWFTRFHLLMRSGWLRSPWASHRGDICLTSPMVCDIDANLTSPMVCDVDANLISPLACEGGASCGGRAVSCERLGGIPRVASGAISSESLISWEGLGCFLRETCYVMPFAKALLILRARFGYALFRRAERTTTGARRARIVIREKRDWRVSGTKHLPPPLWLPHSFWCSWKMCIQKQDASLLPLQVALALEKQMYRSRDQRRDGAADWKLDMVAEERFTAGLRGRGPSEDFPEVDSLFLDKSVEMEISHSPGESIIGIRRNVKCSQILPTSSDGASNDREPLANELDENITEEEDFDTDIEEEDFDDGWQEINKGGAATNECWEEEELLIDDMDSDDPVPLDSYAPNINASTAQNSRSEQTAAEGSRAQLSSEETNEKIYRLDNDSVCPVLLSDAPRMEKSPLLANRHNHPPTHLSPMQFMKLGVHPGVGHTAIISPAGLPHNLQSLAQARSEQGLKVNLKISNMEAFARSGTVWEDYRAAYEDIVKHLER
ncbi:hypothetical protein WN48_10076 [Eufriesea mexicana]|nr:hypothetical protein WN48_10076 [Eufriesea mexicana]